MIEGQLIDATTREIISAETDTQIATAKQYPRDINAFKSEAMALACRDEETAGSCFYCLQRGDKKIEGPSVRLAEIVAYSWGNLRTDTRIVSIDDRFVTAQATCHDLEKNVAKRAETKRRITNKHGQRFNDDMIQVTSNAAMAIALREAVFGVVPRSMFSDIYEEAKRVSVGKAGTNAEKIERMFSWFAKAGATEDAVLRFINRVDREHVEIDDLVSLRGVVTRIKDEGVPVEEALSVDGLEKTTASETHKKQAKEKSTKEKDPLFGDCMTEEDVEEAYQEMKPHAQNQAEIDDLLARAKKRTEELLKT